MASWLDEMLGMGSPLTSKSAGQAQKDAMDQEFRRGKVAGYVAGFNRAKEAIAKMLEEEGKGITAQKVRKMELRKK